MQKMSSGQVEGGGVLDSLFEGPGFVDHMLEQIGRISKAQDQADACSALGEVAAMLGCESAAFATFLQDDPWSQSYRFLLACHPAWCAEYQALSWFADDPWLAYARTHVLPARDDEIKVTTPKQREIVEMAKRFNVNSAFIVPAASPGAVSRLGVLMLGSSKVGYFHTEKGQKFKMVARSLSLELHDWYTGMLQRELLGSSKLSDVDLDLLRHERAGMQSKDIERLMGVSASAIDSRFQRILSRLKVPSRRAASTLAAEYGLI